MRQTVFELQKHVLLQESSLLDLTSPIFLLVSSSNKMTYFHSAILLCIADTSDFDSTALTVTFLADEGVDKRTEWPAPIPVTDDEIDEADQQFFIVRLVLADTNNPAGLLTVGRDASNCIITDNDCK